MSRKGQGNVFVTKVDWWIGLLVLAGVGSCFAIGFGMLFGPEPGEGWITLACGLGMIGFLRLIAWPMIYTIGDAELTIQCGVMRTRIPFDRIEDAQPTRNPISGAAWSLDRVRIDYRKKSGRTSFELISPRRKAEFLRLLEERRASDAQ